MTSKYPLIEIARAVDTWDVTPEQIMDARIWTAECHDRPGLAPLHVALRYVQRNYPGGWGAFVADCSTYVTVGC